VVGFDIGCHKAIITFLMTNSVCTIFPFFKELIRKTIDRLFT